MFFYKGIGMFADVIVDINHADVDKIFEYSFSDESVSIGSRVMVPFGRNTLEGIVIGIKDQSVYPAEKIRPIICVLEDTPALTPETLKLTDYIADTCYVTRALALRLFLPTEMRKGKVKEKFVSFVKVSESVKNQFPEFSKTAKSQKAFLEYILDGSKYKLSEMNLKFGASAVKKVIEKGYAIVDSEKDFRSPYKDLSEVKDKVKLTERQELAVKSIENTQKTITLVYGVTGSGKTEVYLNLIDNALSKGKTAIMLVPEISLTPQMLKQLRGRFGDMAAILHSGLSAGERFDEWWRIRSGEAKIVIGARSAVFAPVENVGIIIIDEEHDGSYSSESTPRYDTLSVALFRAKYNGAKLVLGSATPSIESFMKAKNGEYNLVELPERINKKPLPEVEIVDMRNEIRRGNNTFFSSALKSELEDCLNKGNQAILFLNQRGYSKTVVCTECGHVQKCESCDVSLTYHKEDESLLCHYCGAKYKMITACTECGSPYIRYGGTGTERVVLELQKLYPNAKILRMDRDTTQNKEGHFKILKSFAEKQADILVGTQMIAKGHDFPFVTLVGILDADQSLHFSDYRASERTFQLITQVAGRSGRKDLSGKVVLQTYSPENPVLKQAINYDYLGFYEHEVSVRKATAFPPFTDIIRVLVSGDDEELALKAVKACYSEITGLFNEKRDKFMFFGCMKAPIKKLQGKFRFQILMRIEKGDLDLTNTIYYTVHKYDNKGVSVSFEINPNNLT